LSKDRKCLSKAQLSAKQAMETIYTEDNKVSIIKSNSSGGVKTLTRIIGGRLLIIGYKHYGLESAM